MFSGLRSRCTTPRACAADTASRSSSAIRLRSSCDPRTGQCEPECRDHRDAGPAPFAKPGKSEEYHVMARKAGEAALADAGIPFTDVQQAFAGYVYGDSTCGKR